MSGTSPEELAELRFTKEMRGALERGQQYDLEGDREAEFIMDAIKALLDERDQLERDLGATVERRDEYRREWESACERADWAKTTNDGLIGELRRANERAEKYRAESKLACENLRLENLRAEKYRAEVERLREALSTIAMIASPHAGVEAQVHRIAHAALAAGGETK